MVEHHNLSKGTGAYRVYRPTVGDIGQVFEILANLASPTGLGTGIPGDLAGLDYGTIISAKILYLGGRDPDAEIAVALQYLVNALIAKSQEGGDWDYKSYQFRITKIMREIIIAATTNNRFHFVLEKTQAIMDMADLYKELVIAPLPPL